MKTARCMWIVALWMAGALAARQTVRMELRYLPAPADNPLKGLVPYASPRRHDCFPHSMEFRYLPLRPMIVGQDPSGRYRWDFRPLEQLLADVASRGCQTIFRIYLEYPGHPVAVPQFLLDQGVKVIEWTRPPSDRVCRTPDYEDPRLRQAVTAFIGELGRRYDGDPRIGFITAGFLGLWGEWHDYPRSQLFASRAVQQEVMDAYARAFRVTPILLRYPAGPDHPALAANDTAPFGYHDDSFGWATLDTGRRQDSWFFLAAMKAAGSAALDKWKTFPIGGEIRPELWNSTFTDSPHPRAQDFLQCVRESHVTWLMDSGLFDPDRPVSGLRRRRALARVARMGYELYVSCVTVVMEMDVLAVDVAVENRGVAPFYYNWPIELALLDETDRSLVSRRPDWTLRSVLPGSTVHWRLERLPIDDLPAGPVRLAIRVLNPMPGGRPLYFANQAQQRTRAAWLIAGTLAPGAGQAD